VIGIPIADDHDLVRKGLRAALVAEGLGHKQVGGQLDPSVKTVETRRYAATRKAGLSTTADLVRYALRNHLFQT